MSNILTSVFILHFFNDGIRTAYVTLLPFIAKDLHLTFTQIGFLGASQGTLALLLAIPIGIITSKIGGIKLLFTFLFIYSLCAIGIGFSSTFLLLFLFFYLAATAFGPFHLISQSIVARTAERKTLGNTMGNYTAIGDSGRIAIPAIALFLTTYIAWRNTYFLMAFFGIVIFVALLWFLRNNRHIFQKDTNYLIEETSKEWLSQMLLMLRQKKLFFIILAGLLDGIGGASIYVYLPFFFLSKGISHALLSVFVGAYFAGSLVGKKYLSKGVDTYGPTKIFISAEIFMAVLLVLMTFLNAKLLIFLISAILGLFTRGTAPVVSVMFTTVSKEAHYEKIFAISEIFLGSAAIISPILLGRTADVFGINAAFYIAAGFALLASIPIFIYQRAK